ncbi:MmyB family transcriptional regulator [Cellulomonas telluris]|uniref:MmyB family transcriptional regulator n=1 Tax=Cellulomonas telluris TaxID=2306636 RepID=UPI001CA3A362
MHSRDVAAIWAAGDVADCTSGAMQLHHPTVGAVDVEYQVWLQPDSRDHRLEVYTPATRPRETPGHCCSPIDDVYERALCGPNDGRAWWWPTRRAQRSSEISTALVPGWSASNTCGASPGYAR